MERNVSLLGTAFTLLVGVIGLVGPRPVDAAEPKLVLVASAKSQIAPITTAEARRLYLGVPLVQDGHELIPVRNATDPVAQELFLQRVLFMSAQAYDRQVSGRIYRSGGNRIAEYDNPRELVDSLVTQPWAVTYMTSDAASRQPDLKTVSIP